MDTFTPSVPDNQIMIMLEVLPVAEEEQDFYTQDLAERVRLDVQEAVAQLDGYTLQLIPQEDTDSETRGPDQILLIVGALFSSLVAAKDLLTSLFQLLTPLVEALTKRGNVEEMEIIVNGTPIIFRNVRKKTAEEITSEVITEIEKVSAAPKATPVPSKSLKIQAKVSNKAKKRR